MPGAPLNPTIPGAPPGTPAAPVGVGCGPKLDVPQPGDRELPSKVADPVMPPVPKSWDAVSLIGYFNKLETLDPKGANLAHEVSDYVDGLSNTTLG